MTHTPPDAFMIGLALQRLSLYLDFNFCLDLFHQFISYGGAKPEVLVASPQNIPAHTPHARDS